MTIIRNPQYKAYTMFTNYAESVLTNNQQEVILLKIDIAFTGFILSINKLVVQTLL